MKKLISALLVGCVSAIFADPTIHIDTETVSTSILSDLKAPIDPALAQKPLNKTGFIYVRFAAAESDVARMNPILPGLGIGYRRIANETGAADISISGIGHAAKKSGRIFWTAPKASYIHYSEPDQNKSFYLGSGLAWGGVDSPKQHFIGIIPSVTGGYEFIRRTSVLGFTELNISQPALAVYRQGQFPGPIVEWTVGIGF